jgi:hypothetical protein
MCDLSFSLSPVYNDKDDKDDRQSLPHIVQTVAMVCVESRL